MNIYSNNLNNIKNLNLLNKDKSKNEKQNTASSSKPQELKDSFVKSKVAFKGVSVNYDAEKRMQELRNKSSFIGWHFGGGKTNARSMIIGEQSGLLTGLNIANKIQEDANKDLKKQAEKSIQHNEEQEKIKQEKKELEKTRKIQEIIENLTKVKKNKGFDRIAGYQKEKDILGKFFIDRIAMENLGESVPFPNGVLFYGPTGNGKTTFAEALAEQTQCNFAVVEEETGDCVETVKNIKKEAEKAKQKYEEDGTRTIILVDECESILGKEGETGYDSRGIAMLKTFMSKCADKYKCTLFLTTNHPRRIDPIVLAPDRISVKVFLDPPDKDNTIEVAKHYAKDKVSGAIDYNKLADKIQEIRPKSAFSNSAIKGIIENAYIKAKYENRELTEADLLKGIEEFVPDIKEDALKKYEEEKEELSNIHRN